MDVSQINAGGSETYSHIHFAFATITTDWKVDITKVQSQFDKFVKMSTKAKKILSLEDGHFQRTLILIQFSATSSPKKTDKPLPTMLLAS